MQALRERFVAVAGETVKKTHFVRLRPSGSVYEIQLRADDVDAQRGSDQPEMPLASAASAAKLWAAPRPPAPLPANAGTARWEAEALGLLREMSMAGVDLDPPTHSSIMDTYSRRVGRPRKHSQERSAM